MVVGFLVLSGLADNVLSDYLWARSVLLTSPTVATIGMSITIPLAMISDSLLAGTAAPSGPDAVAVVGAALVMVGFCLVNVDRQTQEAWRKWWREGRGDGLISDEAEGGKSSEEER